MTHVEIQEAISVLKGLSRNCQSSIDGFESEVKSGNMGRIEANYEISVHKYHKKCLDRGVMALQEIDCGE